jgi:hypothetical protein
MVDDYRLSREILVPTESRLKCVLQLFVSAVTNFGSNGPARRELRHTRSTCLRPAVTVH